jgi:hypothetical protein
VHSYQGKHRATVPDRLTGRLREVYRDTKGLARFMLRVITAASFLLPAAALFERTVPTLLYAKNDVLR